VVFLRVKQPATPASVERSSRQAPPVPGCEAPPRSKHSTESIERLAEVIRQRIETRLPGRIRNLAVRIEAETVMLEGQCATFYTKQLAQHAALGVLEDEHLENAIVVTIGQ
jgi:hypothetical protein